MEQQSTSSESSRGAEEASSTLRLDLHPDFYENAEKYWKDVNPDLDGMLGGFAGISSIDIRGSRKFLLRLMKKCGTGSEMAVDCGAGIGRITKDLLMPLFSKVEVVEVTKEFIDQVESHVGPEKKHQLGTLHCCGLQSFNPEPGYYDVIWIQWVIGHLTDEDFVAFFKRCKTGLRPNGIIVLKDNISHGVERDFDEKDSSFTRSAQLLLSLFDESGLRVISQEKQRNFPRSLLEVRMFALQ